MIVAPDSVSRSVHPHPMNGLDVEEIVRTLAEA
jgi:hypothetical protein